MFKRFGNCSWEGLSIGGAKQETDIDVNAFAKFLVLLRRRHMSLHALVSLVTMFGGTLVERNCPCCIGSQQAIPQIDHYRKLRGADAAGIQRSCI